MSKLLEQIAHLLQASDLYKAKCVLRFSCVLTKNAHWNLCSKNGWRSMDLCSH
jgi:hypothetical protein